MLVVEGLFKKYDNNSNFAVKDFSLTINNGEIVGFLGPNGAGKSTTLKAIVGIVPFDDGRVVIAGYDAKEQNLFAKQSLGYVSSDDCSAYESLTGRQYLNFICNVYDIDLELAKERIKYYEQKFNVTQFLDLPITTYSFGYKQIIHLISVFLRKPKVWIFDEPTIGLAPEMAFRVYECMKEAKEEKTTIFFSSHYTSDLERTCDKVVLIQKGKVLEVLDMSEFKKGKKSLREHYLERIGEKK